MGEILGVFSILALILAIATTILAFVFIVPEKKYLRLNKFGKFLHDVVNFKFLIIEKILQALYIFLTAFSVLMGFLMLFCVEDYYYRTVWYGGYGLLVMILGPIAIRLTYEFLMMVILLVKNVIQINGKIKSDEIEQNDIFATPSIDIAPTSNNTAFCPNCGEKIDGCAFCPKCGTKI